MEWVSLLICGDLDNSFKLYMQCCRSLCIYFPFFSICYLGRNTPNSYPSLNYYSSHICRHFSHSLHTAGLSWGDGGILCLAATAFLSFSNCLLAYLSVSRLVVSIVFRLGKLLSGEGWPLWAWMGCRLRCSWRSGGNQQVRPDTLISRALFDPMIPSPQHVYPQIRKGMPALKQTNKKGISQLQLQLPQKNNVHFY